MSGNVRSTENTGLTSKQEAAITALLSCPTIVEAAAEVGVNEKTIRRWMKEPAFLAAYREAQSILFDVSISCLQSKVGKAIETLDRNMSGEEVPAAVQVRAAQIVLEKAVELHKLSDLEEKIREFQAYVDAHVNDNRSV